MRTASLLCLAATASICLVSAEARLPVQAGPTPEQSAYIRSYNAISRGIDPLLRRNSIKVVRPFAEHEKAGFLLFNDEFNFASEEAKIGMAENLPADMTLVVLSSSANEAAQARHFFKKYISQDRLETVNVGRNAGFWARDSLPIPVYVDEGKGLTLGLVDAKYYHGVEVDAEIAKHFNAPLIRYPHFFEGGNFAASTRGDCISIMKGLSEAEFKLTYGCKKWIVLPQLSGIGHIDEHVKFIDDDRVLTDLTEYVRPLQDEGYTVVKLPRPKMSMETYVNSLLVNGTLFMPSYGQAQDDSAKAVYESLGFKVHPLPSNVLSNFGNGSIHCITMTYPNELKAALMEWLQVR